MSGLVGLTGLSTNPSSFTQALDTMMYHGQFARKELVRFDNLQLGGVDRPDLRIQSTAIDNSDYLVTFYGTIWSDKPNWHLVTAEEILSLFIANGIRGLFDFDGSFVLVVVNRKQNVLYLLNDKLGEFNTHYASTEGSFAFAPEAKALFKLLPVRPKIQPEGMLAFLNLGYPVGEQTMFDRICLLPPAHYLEVDLATSKFIKRQYWDLTFSPAKKMKIKDASNALHGALLDGLRITLSDQPDNFSLLMTGGYDSRGTLGLLKEFGRLPNRTITWGIRDNIPDSDTMIAKSISNSFNIPHSTICYDSDGIVQHARKWCYISELSTDNMGNFAVSPDFLLPAAAGSSFLVINDEPFGFGGYPLGIEDAFRSFFKVDQDLFNRTLRGLLQTPREAMITTGWKQTVMRELAQCKDTDLKDIQDYLYLRFYTPRWLFATSYFREPMISVRRPMMRKPVIDLIREVPRSFRVDKYLYMHMLHQYFPDLMALPRNSVSSLVDWSHDFRAKAEVNAMMMELLNPDGFHCPPLWEILTMDTYRSFIHQYFQAVTQPLIRKHHPRSKLFALRSTISRNAFLGKLARTVQPMVQKMVSWPEYNTSTELIRRMAQLSMLQSSIDAGEFN